MATFTFIQLRPFFPGSSLTYPHPPLSCIQFLATLSYLYLRHLFPQRFMVPYDRYSLAPPLPAIKPSPHAPPTGFCTCRRRRLTERGCCGASRQTPPPAPTCECRRHLVLITHYKHLATGRSCTAVYEVLIFFSFFIFLSFPLSSFLSSFVSLLFSSLFYYFFSFL